MKQDLNIAYKMRALDIKKGNVYEYLNEDERDWLIEEAVKLNRCDIGLVIASIVTDAFAEEKENHMKLKAARVYE